MRQFDELIENAFDHFQNQNYSRVLEILNQIPEEDLDDMEDKIAVWEMKANSLYEMGKESKSVTYFEKLENLYEGYSSNTDYLPAYFRALETLAGLYALHDYKRALQYYEKLIKVLEQNEYVDADAQTELMVGLYMKAALLSETNRYIFGAKKYYKKLIGIADNSESQQVKMHQVRAHYQLGNIFIDENKMFDAIKHLNKVIQIKNENDLPLEPSFMAAAYNNLAIASKTEFYFTDAVKYFKKALGYYMPLAQENPEEFLPFVAMTYNNLGNTYVEKFDVRDEIDTYGVSSFSGFGILSAQRTEGPERRLQILDKEEGITYYTKALNLFRKLEEFFPGQYTHYVGTIMHNLGIIHDELERYEKAEEWYLKALEIREKLANQNPDFFLADKAVTLLNLVTLYQGKFESTGKQSYLNKARNYFNKVKPVIDHLEGELPVIDSMKSEKEYFETYFNKITPEFIDIINYKVNKKKWQSLRDETLDIDEKLTYQNQILDHILELKEKYPANKTLVKELPVEYTNLFWFYLQKADLDNARKIKRDYDQIGVPISKEMQINLAHYNLLEGKPDRAESEYKRILADYPETRNEIFITIKNDLFVLFRNGVIENPSSLVGRLEMAKKQGENDWNIGGITY